MSEKISPNSTIAQYPIVSKLGEGGIGEVYRARDAMLGRTTAIKVLPSTLSENTDHSNRFEQKAQAAGALNASFRKSAKAAGARCRAQSETWSMQTC